MMHISALMYLVLNIAKQFDMFSKTPVRFWREILFSAYRLV